MVLVWLTDDRMSKLIVHHMSTVESGMCPVTSQGHQMRKTENKGTVTMHGHLASMNKQRLQAYADKSVTIGEIRVSRES